MLQATYVNGYHIFQIKMNMKTWTWETVQFLTTLVALQVNT